MITLGQASNYSARQMWQHLLAWGTRKDFDGLKSDLTERYQVSVENVALYHTGRSALTVAIRTAAEGKPCQVIIPGLTCIAVVRAVRAAGCEPIFVDIRREDLAYDYEKLEARLAELAAESAKNQAKRLPESAQNSSQNSEKSGQIQPEITEESAKNVENMAKSAQTIDKNDEVWYNGRIVLVQNTLGITWDIEKIQQIAQKYDAKIVEDLAHSAGRKYPNGAEVGTVGVAAALSFGKGKVIDTIAGGAVILRDQATASADQQTPRQILEQPTRKPKVADRVRERWYPLHGAIARHTGKLGQIYLGILVKLHLVQRSADAELDTSRRLTYWQAKLARRQLAKLPTTPLRKHCLVENRPAVLQELKQNHYNLSEIWYDAPVSPPRYRAEADFPEQACPETVKIATQIVNLPTWYPPEKLQRAEEIIKKYEVK